MKNDRIHSIAILAIITALAVFLTTGCWQKNTAEPDPADAPEEVTKPENDPSAGADGGYVPSFETDIVLASGDGAAALELLDESGSIGRYLVTAALNRLDFTLYRYTPCDAPAEGGHTLRL